MPCPCITGSGRKQKKDQRTAIAYADKNAVLEYISDGHHLAQTIAEFYDCLDKKQLRAEKKQINKWVKTRVHIRNVCVSGRGTHLNSRHLGDATVLPKDADQQIVLCMNTLRKDGARVSWPMLTLQAKEVAADKGLGEDKFAADDDLEHCSDTDE
ncbi:hypothetical protein PHMEG_0007926 [Phytophthora megakarya]|uniref:Uncharacterized protein n=1 Tax=Phytophthora megakarya TaxID=4795 RepID=A0A225WJY3_9STRA|nr:hypothetical protein PHMEG_0007926 [Phytophthora megakarya]